MRWLRKKQFGRYFWRVSVSDDNPDLSHKKRYNCDAFSVSVALLVASAITSIGVVHRALCERSSGLWSGCRA
jgi:hypothetical protein